MDDDVKNQEQDIKADPASVVIDLAEKPVQDEKKQEGVQGKDESFSQYLQRIEQLERKLENQRSASVRVQDGMRKEIADLRATKQVVQDRKPSAQESDKFHQLIQEGRDREAVELVVQERIQKAMENDRLDREIKNAEQKRVSILEESTKWVTAKYPQLDPAKGDSEDPFSQVFDQVVNEHPEWHSDPWGPRLALQEAEHRAQQLGLSLKPQKAVGNGTKPAGGGNRVPIGSLPRSRQDLRSTEVVMSSEEKALCDRNGWKYEDYKRNQKQLEQGGSLSV